MRSKACKESGCSWMKDGKCLFLAALTIKLSDGRVWNSNICEKR